MKYVISIAFILNFALIFGTNLTQAQIIEGGSVRIDSNSPKKESEITSAEQQSTTIPLDPVITQAINFSNAIGDWFEDLFDRKKNMSFNTHVNKLEKIVKEMRIALVKPLEAKKNNDVITLAAYNLTSILYARASTTYDTLNAHRNNAGFWKITGALKKVDKTFRSDQERIKLENAFKDLIAKLMKSDATLCKKITQLELAVAENSTRTKKKGMFALGLGLHHRLNC